MENPVLHPKSDATQRERSAESLLAQLFEKAGWMSSALLIETAFGPTC